MSGLRSRDIKHFLWEKQDSECQDQDSKLFKNARSGSVYVPALNTVPQPYFLFLILEFKKSSFFQVQVEHGREGDSGRHVQPEVYR